MGIFTLQNHWWCLFATNEEVYTSSLRKKSHSTGLGHSKNDIRIICFNFEVLVSWHRTFNYTLIIPFCLPFYQRICAEILHDSTNLWIICQILKSRLKFPIKFWVSKSFEKLTWTSFFQDNNVITYKEN